ncbi:MAG: NAD(+) diphosphatase [Rhodocyclaceae bacterium]|nr:NAD(+) diphosphatase [Rhodocyclaceae bacterium]MBX3669817.1 NAD(+) diphosphatase [Rhodocyclaceae bacterium]
MNWYSGAYLDRALRRDAERLAAAHLDADALMVPLWHGRSLVRAMAADSTRLRAVLPTRAYLQASGLPCGAPIALGLFRGQACFALELQSETMPDAEQFARGAQFADLRQIGMLLDASEAGLLAYARAMVHWLRTHRHCGLCGSRNELAATGHALRCSNAQCGHEQFPRLDPAIIVLVHDGDQALLGRQSAWPPDRYSTIAGFVEPGESLEDAVAREVAEETAIRVTDIVYHSSQPWPFPSSLMLGFTARATTRDIILDDRELEDARWFSRADIAAGRPRLPPRQSVAYRLIEHWYDGGAERPLAEEPGAARW